MAASLLLLHLPRLLYLSFLVLLIDLQRTVVVSSQECTTRRTSYGQTSLLSCQLGFSSVSWWRREEGGGAAVNYSDCSSLVASEWSVVPTTNDCGSGSICKIPVNTPNLPLQYCCTAPGSNPANVPSQRNCFSLEGNL